MIAKEIEDFSADVETKDSRSPSQDCPWCNGKEYHHKSSTLTLHREIIDFVKWIAPTKEEMHLRALVIERFRSAMSILWPDAKLIVHGSSATKTYLPNGDIDFVVYGAPKDVPDEILLTELRDHLNSLQIFRKSDVISAKCPIIKGIEKPFGFHVDIAVNNYNGILNIHRNRVLLQTYPALYPLLMFLKFLLFQMRLDEPFHGGISSNTLQQMIIFIIQSTKINERLNLGKLLQTFLRTFGNTFNYITTGISTRAGGRLFSRVEANRIKWRNPINLCIEDPQLPGNFLGENSFKCDEFRNRCHRAFNNMMKVSPHYEQSMLLRIITRPDWLIARRAEMKKQYQALLGNAVESIPLFAENSEEGWVAYPKRKNFRERDYEKRDDDRIRRWSNDGYRRRNKFYDK
ncbi:Nucleotidyltransferase domain containing protein [Histomonas meleagridis]|uniref:Nucleotidyltransferase domain containing protein n=1 Tax=Histomonas meleagridis TaxID=135588 RepID=UPI00355AA302|nr:Nucleotidyltransferase domain containing protein [Histomonas meleagridis]KAH0801825.1 Nucleotidyltransferase domain containing protein [Histomonas meleagridis]